MSATSSNTQTRIGFIGAGNMASALAGGMITNGMAASNITLSDINEEALKVASDKLGVNTTRDNQDLVNTHDVIVLAVKPQVMEQVVQPLSKNFADNEPLVISIAAGITLDNLNTWLGADSALIRCMPNTPALVQKGASGLFANEQVSAEQKQIASDILSSVGIVEWLNSEADIDAVTALSGSGPAYYFLMMEAMIEAGVKLGLSQETAKALTLQTALGAADLAAQSDVEVDELRRRVTSPKGTTEAALNSFQDSQYKEIVEKAMQAAADRSVELAKP